MHVLIGINEEGAKEPPDYRLHPSKSAGNYREMIRDLKARGVEQVLLFLSDGLKDLRSIFLEEYPGSQHQVCWVHIGRAVERHIRRKEYGEPKKNLSG